MKRVYLLLLSIIILTIVVYSQPCNVPNAGNDTAVCSNSFKFSSSSPSAFGIFNWTCINVPMGANLPSFDNPNLLQTTATIGNFYGSYTFVLSESNILSSCIEYDTIIVTFVQYPISQFSTTTVMCNGEATIVNYLGDHSQYSSSNFIWDFDNADIVNGSGAGPYQVTWNNGGSHQISLIINDGVCLSDANMVIIEIPTKIINTISQQNAYCNLCNGEIMLSTIGGNAPYSYLWSNGNTKDTLLNLCAGDYVLTTHDNNNCLVTNNINIENADSFVVITTIDDTICKGQNFTLQAEVITNHNESEYDFFWRDSYGNTNDTNFWLVTPNRSTTYSLTVTDQSGCAISPNPVNIVVGELPEAIFTMEPPIITGENPTINFRNSSLNAAKYLWDFGDGITSNAAIPSHKFDLSKEKYTICLTAENEYNCYYTTCIDIPVYSYLSFYIPSSFTPNGDGNNDCFRPCGTLIDPTTFSMSILDRLGNVIFKTTDYYYDDIEPNCEECYEQPGAWNGKRNNNGEVLPNGTYTWYISFVGKDGIAIRRDGVVTLLR